MQRRNLLKLMGMVGGSAAVVTSTGAFTSVQASRNIAIETAGDANALLAIDDTGNANAEYITGETSGELAIDLSATNPTDAEGSGVNADSVTLIENLFQVQNQGTQTAEVQVSPLTLVDNPSGDGTLIVLIVPQTTYPDVTLRPGDVEQYSMCIGTIPGNSNDLAVSDTITVTGEATQ